MQSAEGDRQRQARGATPCRNLPYTDLSEFLAQQRLFPAPNRQRAQR